MSLVANWSYPNPIRFGAGRIAEIAEACAVAGITKPLLVTDRGLANNPITLATLDRLDAEGLGGVSFAEVDANPTDINSNAGVEVYREDRFCGMVLVRFSDQPRDELITLSRREF